MSQPQRILHQWTASLDQLHRQLNSDFAGDAPRWARAAADALWPVEEMLRRHQAAVEAPDGLPAEVDETRPTLYRRLVKLFQEHGDLLGQVAALQADLGRAARGVPSGEAAGSNVDPAALRQRGEQLLERLQHHREAEIDLVQESVDTDLGAGD